MLAACSQLGGGGTGMFQTGQLIGGGTKQISGAQPVGGFLPNPAALTPGAPGQADLVYYAPDANFSSYNSIILDPVAVLTAPDSALSKVAPSQREALANTFYSDLYKAMSKSCRLTRTARPGTLRLTFALVDADASNATEKTVATYVPYVSAAYGVGSIAFNKGVGYFSGAATAEGYATDAKTGALLWQAVDKRGGTTALAENTLNNWLDVDHSFQTWAAQTVARLTQMGVCRG
jgi:hypothetical protein